MFQETIIALESGAVVGELSARLQLLIAGVQETLKAGQLTLTLKVEPASKDSAEVIFVKAAIAVRMPENDRRRTVFFSTEDHQLVRDNPRQLSMKDAFYAKEGEYKS